MTLKDLMDTSETNLVISEGGYGFPFLIIYSLDCNSSEEFRDVLTPEMLSRNVASIKGGHETIYVALEVPER